MSEPKRYDNFQYETKGGEYVRYEDYARLKAEVERLTAFTTRTIIPNEELQAEVERLKKYNEEAMAHIAKEERKSRERLDMAQAEIERLKNNCDYLDTIPNEELQAQVERLTKAGDAFSYAMDSLAIFANEEARLMARTASLAFKDARNAAKEGKGQP
jgi:cell division GTPase FtsZ